MSDTWLIFHVILIWFYSCTMMVNLSIFIISKMVNVCVKKNLHERKKEIKNEPYVHHLDVRGFGKIVRHVDKHGRKDEHAGQVHCDNGFKKESFEVVCTMSDEVQ